ncbi:MAG: hypothetical protein JNK58_08295 [Phycisphaerae bacterium]|nr:hypothetical protein [Phycisphaerae bacterium]
MRNAAAFRTIAPLAFLAAAASLTACSDGGRLWSYRNNPTPDMNTLGMVKETETNRDVMTHETNGRALNDDGARFWLTDRPSRLTPRRVPY